jgi:hypothetical protein
MLKYFKIIALLAFGYMNAQSEKSGNRIFWFWYGLDSEQQQTILDLIAKADTSKIESVQIYGYCDDRGNADYNYKLSEERVSTVRNLLTANGLKQKQNLLKERTRNFNWWYFRKFGWNTIKEPACWLGACPKKTVLEEYTIPSDQYNQNRILEKRYIPFRKQSVKRSI